MPIRYKHEPMSICGCMQNKSSEDNAEQGAICSTCSKSFVFDINIVSMNHTYFFGKRVLQLGSCSTLLYLSLWQPYFVLGSYPTDVNSVTKCLKLKFLEFVIDFLFLIKTNVTIVVNTGQQKTVDFCLPVNKTVPGRWEEELIL